MVVREKAGRAFVYRASAPRDAYIANLMSDALSTTRDRRSALLRFVEGMSAAEVRNLRQALEAIDNETPTQQRRRKRSGK
jgi:predicted transcriptional regulator